MATATKPKDSGLKKVFAIDPEQAQQAWESLTPREQRIAASYAQGGDSPQIAVDHGISTKTLDIHRSNICHKLGNIRPWGIGRFYFAARALGLPFHPEGTNYKRSAS